MKGDNSVDKKMTGNILEKSGIVLLALSVIFTIMSILDKNKGNKNNLILALFCVSLSNMLNIIREHYFGGDCGEQCEDIIL